MAATHKSGELVEGRTVRERIRSIGVNSANRLTLIRELKEITGVVRQMHTYWAKFKLPKACKKLIGCRSNAECTGTEGITLFVMICPSRRRMKIALCMLALVTAIFAPCQDKAPFTLIIRPEHDMVKAGHPVIINVVKTNTSNTPLNLKPTNNPGEYYDSI
jgi:hypothetical protein